MTRPNHWSWQAGFAPLSRQAKGAECSLADMSLRPSLVAALALAGQYMLVLPPQSYENDHLGPPALMAPLSDWRNEDQFDSVKECQDELFTNQWHFRAPKETAEG
jgi:hypothetical protein